MVKNVPILSVGESEVEWFEHVEPDFKYIRTLGVWSTIHANNDWSATQSVLTRMINK